MFRNGNEKENKFEKNILNVIDEAEHEPDSYLMAYSLFTDA